MKIEIINHPKIKNKFLIVLSDFEVRANVEIDSKLEISERVYKIIEKLNNSFLEDAMFQIRKKLIELSSIDYK